MNGWLPISDASGIIKTMKINHYGTTIRYIKIRMNAGELLIIKDGKLVKSNGKPLAKSEIRRMTKSLEIKNDILQHQSTKVEGSKYE